MAAKKKENADRASDYDENKDFLERTGVSQLMRNALVKIVSNRPVNPVDFLAQYFENLEEKSNKITRAYQLLLQTDHTRAAFHTNVYIAYEILSTGVKSTGLSGSPYNQLLDKICRDVPKSIYQNFVTKVGPRDHEVIPFGVFYSGVVAAFILVDYVNRTRALFSLVSHHKDSEPVIDSYLADTLVTTLTDAISAANSKDPLMVLEAGARFTDEELSDEIVEAMSVSQSSNRQAMTKDEFLEMAANVYLQEVKPVR